jgi:hypothetical protein
MDVPLEFTQDESGSASFGISASKNDGVSDRSRRERGTASDSGLVKMPDPKDDPKSSEWRPYMFARDQWHCRICGDRFLYSEMVRKHIANEHNETMPPSMYEYFHGAVWQRKKLISPL